MSSNVNPTAAQQWAYTHLREKVLSTPDRLGSNWRKEFFYSPLMSVEPRDRSCPLTPFQSQVGALRESFVSFGGSSPIEEVDRFAREAQWTSDQRRHFLTVMLSPKAERAAHRSYQLFFGSSPSQFRVGAHAGAALDCRTVKEPSSTEEAVDLPNVFDHSGFKIGFTQGSALGAEGYPVFRANLSSMSLTRLPPSFSFLRLTELDMTSNRFSEVPLDVGKITGLRKLNLSRNPISHRRTQHLAGLHLLQVLTMTGNNIARIPSELAHCTALRELNLSKNPISHERTQNLARLHSLQVLTLTDAHLRRIPSELVHCTALGKLSLKKNHIRTTVHTLRPLQELTRLRELDLSHNRLTYTEGVERLTSLRSLNVASNRALVCTPVQLTQLNLNTFNRRPFPPEEKSRKRTHSDISTPSGSSGSSSTREQKNARFKSSHGNEEG